MPIVTIRAFEGRTVEQKRKLAKDITDVVMKNFGTLLQLETSTWKEIK